MASVTAAVVAVILRRVRRLEVDGLSMVPVLAPGDRVVVIRTRRGRRMQVGDLAVVPDPRDPTRLMVKRVVEVTGDLVTVAGDNAGPSTDSRAFGPVPHRTVWGRAVYRYHPPDQRGRLVP